MDVKTVAAYVRVSSERQASDEHYSIPEQTDRLKAYCAAKGWTLAKIYTDGGYSGKNLNRPAMQELIKECKLYDLILVNKLDRLSRSQKDTLYLIEDVFRAQGVQFASISENFDTTTPLGMAMVGILSVFAQLEREQIKERMHMGRVGRAKKGLWRAGSNPPIGYDYTDGHLIIREDEAEQVRLIYRMFLSGESMYSIARFMHDNFKNKYRSWNQTNSVSVVLRNPLYTGKIVFDSETYDGDHEAIIDQDTFDKAQERYSQIMRDNPRYRIPFKSKYLLTGILFCGECGARYSVLTSKNPQMKNKRYTYYGCRGSGASNQDKRNKHKCKYYNQEKLDQYIIDQVMQLEFHETSRKPIKVQKKSKERIAIIDKQISNLIDLYSVDGINLEEIKTKITELNAEKDKLKQEEPEVKSNIHSSNDIIRAKDVLQNGSQEDKRMIITSLIDRVLLFEDRIEIVWNL